MRAHNHHDLSMDSAARYANDHGDDDDVGMVAVTPRDNESRSGGAHQKFTATLK
jgi:hypothetical protein